MKKLTKEQYNNVIKAIDLAKGPGECRYCLSDGNPICVIAQLLVIEGDDISCLAEVNQRIGATSFPLTLSIHQKYDVDFLDDLQNMWDDTEPSFLLTEDAIKQNMKAFVDSQQQLAELSE